MEIKVRPSARIGDYERGITAERERIIKLIPEYMATVLEWGHETASKQLIALIKGENKPEPKDFTGHCSDCNEWDCVACTCAGLEPDCTEHSKGENK